MRHVSLAARVLGKLERVAIGAWHQHRDRLQSTFGCTPGLSHAALFSTTPNWATDSVPEDVLGHYLRHEFDLLGSGWVHVTRGAECAGLEGFRYGPAPAVHARADGDWLRSFVNPSNIAESRRVWGLIDGTYEPIDWQLDFRSGHRWCERQWSGSLSLIGPPGADIKVPWELSRMQHLPQMAIAWARGSALAQDLVRDIRNEMLDFIATNPPRFGANWACPMDVAIRAVNWITTMDILEAGGCSLDRPFVDTVRRSVHDHGVHIFTHLEWWWGHRNNHYLADIAGLAFIGSWLQGSPAAARWLEFAVSGLSAELPNQFHEEGSHFEGSTAYHGLAAEMAIYATAVVVGSADTGRLKPSADLSARNRVRTTMGTARGADVSWHMFGLDPRPLPFSEEYMTRLAAIERFARAVSMPGGSFVQIGDNDSGRFLNVQPSYRRIDPDAPTGGGTEDRLTLSHVIAAAEGLGWSDRSDVTIEAPRRLEAELVRCLAGGRRLVSPPAVDTRIRTYRSELKQTCPDEIVDRRSWSYDLNAGDLEHLTFEVYPAFGIFLLRGDRMFLALRAMDLRIARPGPHCHQDQLHVELATGVKKVLADPGSYSYTGLPAHRILYRSRVSHCVPWLEEWHALDRVEAGFAVVPLPDVECVYAGSDRFEASARHGGLSVTRVVRWSAARIEIVDSTDGTLASGFPPVVRFSPGYGKVE